jgi:hypothetical protein
MRGLNRLFYSMALSSRTWEDNEIAMLSNLFKESWYAPFIDEKDLSGQETDMLAKMKKIKELTKHYSLQIERKEAIVESKLSLVGNEDAKV